MVNLIEIIPLLGYLPVVTSFRAGSAAGEYSNGLRKPSGGFPAAMSRSFSSDTMLAKIGVEQLVPATDPVFPATTIWTFSPCAATSGKARPVTLNFPAFSVPMLSRIWIPRRFGRRAVRRS